MKKLTPKYKDLKEYSPNHKYNPNLIGIGYDDEMLGMEIRWPEFIYRFKFNDVLECWEGNVRGAKEYFQHIAIYRGNAKHLKQFKEHLFFDKEEV